MKGYKRKTEVPDDLRLPGSLRQKSYFAHPKNKDEQKHDGQAVNNATICVTVTMAFTLFE